MMDFAPRDFDDDRPVAHLSHDPRSRDGGETRPTLGRGPSSADREHERPSRDQVIDLRDRDHDGREHHRDGPSRDVFERHVDLPRGPEREVVHDGRREYTLRGSETRTLSTVGAFRVVSSRDLLDARGTAADPRAGDLRHLREQGLIGCTRGIGVARVIDLPGAHRPTQGSARCARRGRGLAPAGVAPGVRTYWRDAVSSTSHWHQSPCSGYAGPVPASPVRDREDTAQRLSACQAEIVALGVRRLALFGSILNGRPRLDSDVDFLVEFVPGEKTYDRLLALAALLEDRLGRRVELVTTSALSPFIGPRILAEASDVVRAA